MAAGPDRVQMDRLPGTAALNRALFRWFARSHRDLAFRRTRDPWAVLVAETMLQQTQAARVEPVWEAFMVRFPTGSSLAVASPADAVRAWAGLGYYGRAIRLHRAAREIVARHGGVVPDDLDALERLPGVGRYTARAVGAQAFGRKVAAVDTNVGRVVARVFGVPSGPGSATRIQRSADAWVAARRPAEWTHAVMDLGATVCRARAPECRHCPLRTMCASAGRVGVGATAATTPANRRPRGRGVVPRARFESTRRWLRGRIVARLSDETDGAWVRLVAPIGTHSGNEVEAVLADLAREGLIERDRVGRARLAS